MPKEIERKFLVTSKEFKKGATVKNFVQGYLSMEENKVIRARIEEDKAFLTIKTKISDISRLEYEYPIPVNEAKEILDKICLKPLITKKRYFIEFSGKTWEVDIFSGENSGLVIAEIELQSETENFKKPDWIGEEVTSVDKYYNFNLVKNPYSKWNK